MAEVDTVSGFNLAWPLLALLLPVPWLLRAWLKAAPQSSLQALKVPWYGLMAGSGSSRCRPQKLPSTSACPGYPTTWTGCDVYTFDSLA